MAARAFKNIRFLLETGVVDLFANVAIGATGAPTLTSGQCKGFFSIARQSAGKYRIYLGAASNQVDVYARVMQLNVTTINSTASGVATVQITSDQSAAAAPYIEFLCLDAAGAAVDPADGEVLLLQAILKNSSV